MVTYCLHPHNFCSVYALQKLLSCSVHLNLIRIDILLHSGLKLEMYFCCLFKDLGTCRNVIGSENLQQSVYIVIKNLYCDNSKFPENITR